MTQTERDAQRAASARARREAARVLREKAIAAKMAARAEALAAKAEARLGVRAERWDERRDAKAARAVALAMRDSDRRTNHQVLGAVLLAIGGNWLLAELGLFPFGWAGLLAAGLMTLGIAMISTAKAGRTKPLVALGVLMTFLLATSSGVAGGFNSPNVGDKVYRITTSENLLPSYQTTVGDMVLDLGGLALDGPQTVRASTQVGDLEVILPRDLAVKVVAETAGIGDVNVLEIESDGFGQRVPYTSEGFAEADNRLTLYLDTTLGDINVERR